MRVLIVESDMSKRILEDLKGSGLEATQVDVDNLIKGELGTLDDAFKFIDVKQIPVPQQAARPRVQPSYRSLLRKRY